MGEKLKDLIYDFSDIIISLIIITLIFGVVSWKISDSMAYSSFTEKSTEAALDTKEDEASSDATEVTTGQSGSDQTATGQTSPDQTASGDAQSSGKPAASATAGSDSSGSGSTASGSANPTATPAKTPVTTPAAGTAAPIADFKVDIPSGSSGIAIAKILKEKGIITDTKMFITRVDQLKMGPKLKAGSFTIKAGSTLDDVIYTLAGKKK